MKEWNETQIDLLKQGLSSKETQLLINELTASSKLWIIIFRGEDATYIVLFVNNDVTACIKRKVMYHQVCFAQGTGLSLPKSSEVFHLM